MNLPEVVSRDEWQRANDRLVGREKEATRARDALAAERRRQPMARIDDAYVFAGPDGEVRLVDLFAGRRQLILYRFFYAPDVEGWPESGCGGCSMVVDNLGHLAHLNARDTTFALTSAAPQANIERLKARMDWDVPWYTTADDFSADFGVAEYFALMVFLRDGDDVFLTYFTRGRGVEALGPVWTLLDLTPLGRQEEWEDTPEGRVEQTPPYSWWQLHDEY